MRTKQASRRASIGFIWALLHLIGCSPKVAYRIYDGTFTTTIRDYKGNKLDDYGYPGKVQCRSDNDEFQFIISEHCKLSCKIISTEEADKSITDLRKNPSCLISVRNVTINVLLMKISVNEDFFAEEVSGEHVLKWKIDFNAKGVTTNEIGQESAVVYGFKGSANVYNKPKLKEVTVCKEYKKRTFIGGFRRSEAGLMADDFSDCLEYATYEEPLPLPPLPEARKVHVSLKCKRVQ